LGLPKPARVERQINLELDAFAQSYDALQVRSQQTYGMLNQEQRLIYDSVMGSIPTGNCYFLDGKAGREKTFLVNAICDRIRGKRHIACITGSIAFSVTLYERGRTAHSMFGIPVRENASDLQSTISIYSGRAEVLQHTALIV
jgi:predicted ATPase